MENAKIDIYPSPEIRQMIENDIELFEIFKDNKNSEPMKGNTNAFLNRLFNGYKYKEEMEKFAKLLDTYPMTTKDIRKLIDMMLDNEAHHHGNNTEDNLEKKRLSFKPTQKNYTTNISEEIDKDCPHDMSRSGFICKILKLYFKKPLYQRERIIFQSEYENISCRCQKKCIKFYNLSDNQWYTVMPYKIFLGKEQMFNYVFCYGLDENNTIKNYSFRLSRMSQIQGTSLFIPCPEDIEKNFSLTQSLGASYAINTPPETSCVLLTKKGLSSFRHIYFGRPKIEKKEPAPNGCFRYSFNCSEEQLYR
ncbi:MAG: WYL domain-containing protein, partial [Lachnoanaerobaculum sp.]